MKMKLLLASTFASTLVLLSSVSAKADSWSFGFYAPAPVYVAPAPVYVPPYRYYPSYYYCDWQCRNYRAWRAHERHERIEERREARWEERRDRWRDKHW